MPRICSITRLRPVRPAWICSRLFLLFVAVATLLLQTPATAQTTSGTIATGNTLFNSTFNCHICHTVGSPNRFNAIDAGGHIAYANARGMGGTAGSAQNFADIAAYIASTFAPSGLGTQSATFETAKAIGIPNIALGTVFGNYAGLRLVVGPSRGSVSFSGTTATYTPSAFQCGFDVFSYEAFRNFITPFTVNDGGTSNTRAVGITISNPAAPSIVFSASTLSGIYNTVIANFNPVSTGGAPHSYAITSGTLPTGLGLNLSNGVISGTPTQVGTFVVNLTARNCFNGNLDLQSSTKTITITIAKSPEAITFAPLPPKLTSDAPFSVFATGGGSVSAVTFSASGVCSSSGTNGATITLTGTVGTCSVSADQLGDTNYLAAPTVVQNFSVVAPGELFPPNCQLPLGFSVPGTANAGWSVVSDFASNGVCSLKSSAITNSQKAQIAFTGVFNAANVSFTRKTDSEANFDCFRFYVDGVTQAAIGGLCQSVTLFGISGAQPFTLVSIPITAGSHTLMWSYEKDGSVSIGADAAWIDELVLPIAPTTITSAATATGSFGQFFLYTISATNSPWNYSATGIPPGIAINQFGQIFGTPTAVGIYNMMVTVTNGSSSATQAVTVTIAQGDQGLIFAPLQNKRFNDPIFGVSATPGVTGNPVTWSSSGVCINGGINGDVIQLSGALGTCSVTATQLGNANYLDSVIMQTFLVFNPAQEYFPPNCILPAGWAAGGTVGWSVAQDASTEGGCSLKSGAITNSQSSSVSVFLFTAAGNITFKRRVSSESGFDCFQFSIDGVAQNVGGTCTFVGLTGASGELPFTAVSVPVALGFHTLLWNYVKDSSVSRGSDAAWIDELVIPQIIVTVNKVGGGSGVVTSFPTGLNCGATCAFPFSNSTNGGLVNLFAAPTAGSYLASWSGGGCSGNGVCAVSTNPAPTVTATFSLITVPNAPTGVAASPGNQTATVSFTPPAFNGGSPIIDYTATCGSNIGSGMSSPIVVSGLTNGTTVNCKVVANNAQGSSPASALVSVTPRTVPGSPTGVAAAPGNNQATVSFTAPISTGGSAITNYTATCGAQSLIGAGSPLVVTGLTNGIAVNCAVTANNIAGSSVPSASVPVTPRTVPGAPTSPIATPRDGRAILDFVAPVSDGGSAITSYAVSCNAGAATASGASAPITLTGLTNGVNYACTVAAVNAAGAGPTAAFATFSPLVNTGATFQTQICSACHATPPAVPQLNAAGTTPAVLTHVIANQPLMSMTASLTGLTTPERTAIAQYLKAQLPTAPEVTPFNTAKLIDFSNQITVMGVAFDNLEVVSGPANGTLSAFSGTGITYTPTPGFVGSDSFTFRGVRTAPVLQGDARTVTITVSPPSMPVITSAATANGTNGAAFVYQITASNAPTSFGASGLAAGLSLDPLTGLISGTPVVGGTFNATITATNAGGTGMAPLTITLNAANQFIVFPAQTISSIAFSPPATNTFAISPLATASSLLAITYSSNSPSICTVSATTVTMVSAGNCVIAANQFGDANFNIAAEVTQPVAITPILPGAPTIGTATPNHLQATIAFLPPANTGGTVIIDYTVSCTPSGTATAMVSPITVPGLIDGITYTCTVRARNSVGTGPASGSVMVTPVPTPTPPMITSANATSFTVNAASTFNVTATGTPSTFTFSRTGALPSGINFNTMTGALAGTPALGTVGAYPLTLGASNAVVPDASQAFTLTVAKADQTIAFTGPANQTFSIVPIPLTATATSALTVGFSSSTASVCTVAGANVTLVSVGTCTINANQTGDANYNAAPIVPQSFSVVQGGQTIAFGAQTSPRAYVASGTFSLLPVATASSGLAISYSSLTTGICTIAATTVTMLRAGQCTIAANQSGNANVSAATAVAQTITFTGFAPGAPTIGTATAGDAKAFIAFTSPLNDGGGAITSYTATCSGISGSGSASPVTVNGLANGVLVTCTVTATNAFGVGGPSGGVTVTPAPLPGATVWANTCGNGGCHGNPPVGFRLNAGGTSSTVLDYVVANPTPLMSTMVIVVNTLSAQQKTDVAAYIRDFIPAVSATTASATPVGINVGSQVILNTPAAAFTSLQAVTLPVNGTLSAFTGTTVTYTPNPVFVGTDTFTYRATQAALNSDIRTVTVTVTPAAPAIISPATASGTVTQPFSYQIIASNAPSSYGAINLPGGITIDTATGLISGTPGAAGVANATISAIGAGGTGNSPLTITISLIGQSISFGAQTSPRNYSAGGSFMISPTATGGASGMPVIYTSTTTSVCSVSGTTVLMLTAGNCTIAANQAGNATYSAATPIPQSITINPIAPGAPVLVSGTAGNAQATITFTAPSSNGGSGIQFYTASCGGISVSGPGSPIVVSGLNNGMAYSCAVTATSVGGISAPSNAVMVTPVAILFTGNVFSRKLHGNGIGEKDLAVIAAPINGAITVEPRAIGAGHRIVFVFDSPVLSVVSLAVVDANLIAVGSASPSFNANELVVTLSGVPDNQRVTVTATGINGALDVSRAIGFLVGDVGNNRAVTAADINAVKARIGVPVNMGNNFLFDLNTSGTITNADVSAVKARSGIVLAP